MAGAGGMILAMVMAVQAASAQPAPTPPQSGTTVAPERFSVLASPAPPCPETRDEKGDIIVCAANSQQQRLPLPDDTGPPDGPTASNPYKTGIGALNSAATPCPISRDCIVGFGPPIVPMVKGAVDLAKKAFAKKPDKKGRVPIDLNDEPISTAGKILP
jgi:hypothetical protein